MAENSKNAKIREIYDFRAIGRGRPGEAPPPGRLQGRPAPPATPELPPRHHHPIPIHFWQAGRSFLGVPALRVRGPRQSNPENGVLG